MEDIYSWALGLLNGFVLLALLLTSAFISSSEAAFFSLSRQQILQLQSNQEGDYSTLIRLIQNPTQLLATLLIIGNLINIAFITLSTYLLWQIFEPNGVPNLIMVLYTLGSTTVIVLLSEIIPKTYGNQNNLQVARKAATFIQFFVWVLRPLSRMLIRINQVFGKLFTKDHPKLSIEQFNRALEITTAQGSSESEKAILKGVINFNTLTVKQIMQPRTEILAAEIGLDFPQLIDLITQSGYSRFPVYKETIDHVVGFLYIRDLLPYLEGNMPFTWQSLLRKCLFVPENKRLDTLLLEFQERKTHIAVVVDEYGGTAGLITMEDIIEEIVGEIADEFDQAKESFYKKIDDHNFEFASKILLHDFCKILGIKPAVFETVKGASESLGGLLLEINKELPVIGEKIVYKQFTFTILAVDTRKIKKVRVSMHPYQPIAALGIDSQSMISNH